MRPSSSITVRRIFCSIRLSTASSFIVVFLSVFDLCVKKLCQSPLRTEMLGCSITKTLPIVAFMVFYSFQYGFVAFLLCQTLLCE